jgi:hypothetical protein
MCTFLPANYMAGRNVSMKVISITLEERVMKNKLTFLQ